MLLSPRFVSYVNPVRCQLITSRVTQENETMSAQLNELRMQIERLDYENKEAAITVDILREQNQDLTVDLDEQKKIVEDLQSTQRDPSEEDKEKKKAEKMAMMMAQFDTVRSVFCAMLHLTWLVIYSWVNVL